MKVSPTKLNLIMARNKVNPYDLCEKAEICYASYHRIVSGRKCKPATVGRLASALQVDVVEILEEEY